MLRNHNHLHMNCLPFLMSKKWEVVQLKVIVSEIDPDALVFVSEVHEAIGEGFKSFEALES